MKEINVYQMANESRRRGDIVHDLIKFVAKLAGGDKTDNNFDTSSVEDSAEKGGRK